MATLFINEYQGIGVNAPGIGINAPNEPAVATQVVTYTGTANQSSPFNAKTKLITITSDGIFSYRVTTAGTAATTANFRVPAGVILALTVNGGDTISAITNT